MLQKFITYRVSEAGDAYDTNQHRLEDHPDISYACRKCRQANTEVSLHKLFGFISTFKLHINYLLFNCVFVCTIEHLSP